MEYIYFFFFAIVFIQFFISFFLRGKCFECADNDEGHLIEKNKMKLKKKINK